VTAGAQFCAEAAENKCAPRMKRTGCEPKKQDPRNLP
jgi:hypothetical protein